jgi:hypothetical protein
MVEAEELTLHPAASSSEVSMAAQPAKKAAAATAITAFLTIKYISKPKVTADTACSFPPRKRDLTNLFHSCALVTKSVRVS